MRILGIIPARAGSKGVPGKNTRMLGDMPLIAYTIKQALQSRSLSTIVVSSDSEEILELSKSYGIKEFSLRPPELATDTATSISVVQHLLSEREGLGEQYDAVCLLQPTCPFRAEGFIDLAIQKFIDSDADSLISVLPIPHEFNPHWAFKSDSNHFLDIATGDQHIISRRQDLPVAYFRDGGIYITAAKIARGASFYGNRISFIESNPGLYINIDTNEDWEKAEALLSGFKRKS